MRRVLLLLASGCLVAVCYVVIRLVFQPPIELLIPPDATDIQVVHDDWGEWSLTYRVPGPPYGLYARVAHHLEAKGWARSGESYTGGPLLNLPTYTRVASFGFATLLDQAELDGDPRVAHIRLRQWIALQPLKALSPLTSPFDR